MRSVIYVPIRSQLDGTIRGAMACILAGSDPRVMYTAEDLRFAEEVAVRAGLAFDNARAYEREKRIAVTLQAASLPKALPTIDHLYLSADYRPGKSEATIGGDWYDAFALDNGCVAITVGDVLGNGLAAAVTMGRLRQSMRVVATLIAEPNAMLDAADRTVRGESDETYATALAGVFDPRTHQFTFASAGHPSPVLRHPDGRIEEFDVPGMMLGLRPGTSLQTFTIDVTPGSTLVFFTDGLTEATRDIDEGHRRLHAAMADADVARADNPAHALVEHVLMGRPPTDDIAVLVAEVGPSKRFDERLRTASRVAAGHEQVTIAG
jgi:serine phosphatase RsbU (regulator of sigma subunit)